jgi:hypothetical protein
MADKSMKAVIWAEFDPRGVVKGVAAANTELAKLNKTSSAAASSARLTATMGAINMAWGVVSSAVQQIDERMKNIAEQAGKYSPEALSAKATTKSVEIQRDMAMGKALGVDVAAAERIKQQSMLDEAKRASEMVGGLSAWQSIKTDALDAWNKVLEIPATVFANLDNPMKSRPDDVSRFWSGTTGAELAALPTGGRVEDRARANADQEQTQYLRQIAKAVGQ